MSEWAKEIVGDRARLWPRRAPWPVGPSHRPRRARPGRPRSVSGDPQETAATVCIPADEIRRTARHFAPLGSLPRLWLRQRYREFIIGRKHVRFRSSDNGEARTAYLAIGRDEFADINALQAWANWRTLPHNLSGRLPARPVFIVDLCCGLGQSTAVLAHYCRPGSFILGLEANPAFADAAGKRAYAHRDGSMASVAFRAQSVLDLFRDNEGRPIADGSVDLVNAVGAIACHFQPDAAEKLVVECARVLGPRGLALLDAGREGTRPRELRAIAESGGLSYEGRARSCLLDRHWQLCFRRIAGDSCAPQPCTARARTQTTERTRSRPC